MNQPTFHDLPKLPQPEPTKPTPAERRARQMIERLRQSGSKSGPVVADELFWRSHPVEQD